MALRDWQAVEDTRCYGVANFNFELKGVGSKGGCWGGGFLKIHLGEPVCIKAEYKDWFFVRNVETEEEGLVPKSYICIKDCSVVRNGDSGMDYVSIYPKTPTLVQEINAALREWNKIAQDLYVQCNVPFHPKDSHTNNLSSHGGASVISSPSLTSVTLGPGPDETDAKYKFFAIRTHSMKLHESRKKILSSKLTVEELKELKKSVASTIDYGNTLLKLDMVVRDDLGLPLNPAATSTIELFRKHKSSSQKLKKNRGSKVNSQIFSYSTHSLIISVESVNWRIVDECEVRFFLCDARDKDVVVPFTESIQINLRAGRAPQTPFKFLFTDLGKNDFGRQKVYLVAYVVRIGPMEFKEVDSKKDNIPFSDKRNNNIQVRRPYGVAARDISNLFHATQVPKDFQVIDNESYPLFYTICQGDETMEDAFKKLRAEPGANTNGKDIKPIGLLAKLNMVAGNPGQIQQEQPLLMRGVSIYGRKMGFPEVILPQDIRNDLYININRGEFHRAAKTTDRNVEVTVSVHNEKGQTLGPIISGGNGSPPVSQYKSVVYYHNDKPRWNEYLRINLPMSIEDFSTAHVRFTFKHRSSSDNKDKAEKPFALSYLRLKENEGTAIKDATHDLCLYKIDSKHYRENETQYLSLPSTRVTAAQSNSKPSCPGFSCSFKDGFFVGTTLCSTNFTQNADLLELLLWVTKLRQLADNTIKNSPDIKNDDLVKILLDALTNILNKVTKVSGEEIVKFLNPIFDALFLILVDPMEQIQTDLYLYETGYASPETCDRSVFECLLHIFLLMSEHKFQNFQSVLNLYIEDNFSSTLAYTKLAVQLKTSIYEDPPNKLLKVMKCMEFYFKFIIKSFQIHKQLKTIEYGRTEEDRDDDEQFERIIGSLFEAMSGHLLCKPEIDTDQYIAAEGVCLKEIPTVIGDLVKVFPKRKLSEHLVALCCVVPQGKLTGTKLACVMDIVHSEVFIDTECRFLLLPMVTENILPHLPGNDNDKCRRSVEYRKLQQMNKIKQIFGETVPVEIDRKPEKETPLHSDETEKAVELFGDLMHILHQQPEDQKEAHISYVMQRLIRPIIFSIGTLGDNDHLAGNMVAIFLSVLREMTSYHYSVFVNILKSETGVERDLRDPYKQGLLKFINDVLVVMKNLFRNSYFPHDWNAMILLQNSIVLTALEHFAEIIKKEFKDPFEGHPWYNFFHCAVSFLTQPSLQLEEFFPSKRNYILQNYGDMRKSAVEMIKNMWFSIYASKRIRFIPSMVGEFLDMAFVPEPDIRTVTIPIFYDMMHCEFDQERIHKSFNEVEDELTKKIVEGFEGGKGDLEFRYIFYEEMSKRCEHNTTGLRNQGLAMVETVTKLMDLLLQYREVIAEEDAGNRMSCIVNLLDFSKEIDRKELYLRYLYKLHDLHIKANNYTEAAFTLKLHSRLLNWSDEEVPALLRAPNKHLGLVTHMELKESIYNDIIEYFKKSEMWECALEVCDELRQQYEESYVYSKLPRLHQNIATLYDKILKEARYEPEYFRVAFYGTGFPSFLQDKVFIYRGDAFEKLSTFESRMMCRYLQAELLKTLGKPSEEIRNSNKQYLQICKVDPVMSTSKRDSGMKYAAENIRKYYTVNEIDKFTFSRPFHQEPKDPDNPFASLWLDRYTLWTSQSFPGIMRWFPVIRDNLVKIRPIENSLETLEKANEQMRILVLAHYIDPNKDTKDLQMKLHGILDPAVMGGVANYEKTFLQPQYLDENPQDAELIEKLKQLICIQVPIIEECLKMHERKLPPTLIPLHRRHEEMFVDLVKHIEATYGVEKKNLKDLVLEREIARAEKKNQAIAKRNELNNPPKESKLDQFIQSASAGHRGSAAIMRNVGSTTSLYQNPYACKAKGSGTLSKANIFRRSTHNSFSGSIEGEHNFTQPSGPPNSATLPRNGHFFNSSAGSMLPPLQSEPEGNEGQVILPTEKLITQRPPRPRADQRKSQSWNDGGGNNHHRYSGDSFRHFPVMPAQSSGILELTSGRSSLESPDSAIDPGSSDEKPPPLPPKPRGEKNDKPPVPPPKKPPIRQLKEM